MKKIICLLGFLVPAFLYAQELYVYTEPASNMAKGVPTVRLTGIRSIRPNTNYRTTAEGMYSVSKKLMFHTGIGFSDMHTRELQFESVYLYGKYRFFSRDEVHQHFRMAAFLEGAYSRNLYHYDEVSLQGDRSGVQAGMIATQLINKLAVSGTVSHTQTFDDSRAYKDQFFPERLYSSINYSLSGGYLVLPREYKSFRQLNMNVYVELLGQQALQRKSFYLDLAPSIQFLFNSNTKVNLGYRVQLTGNQTRGMQRSVLVALEHSFFGKKAKS